MIHSNNVHKKHKFTKNSQFFFRFILESIFGYTLKSSLNIKSLLSRGLKVWYVPLGSTPCFCFLLRNLKQKQQMQTCRINPPCTYGISNQGEENLSTTDDWNLKNNLRWKITYNSAISTINIYFVSQHHKWEVFRIRWTGLKIKSIRNKINHRPLETVLRSSEVKE